MPELNFEITGVEAVTHGLVPLLHFKLRITAAADADAIQAVLLNAQIQLQCPQRSYTAREQERLVELFGPPAVWAQTLRNRLWAHSHATLGSFTGRTETVLPVPCTYDLNVAAAKYLYALEGGEVPLLFLFSGSVFIMAEGRLQVVPISWNRECTYALSLQVWKELLEQHYPGMGWLPLRHEVFERLYAYKLGRGLTWEQTIDRLLQSESASEALAEGPARVLADKEVAA